jgi:uncharacterized protein YdeI (YjbR/CyaY-like superfamily)
VVPPDLRAAFKRRPGARRSFESFSRSSRRMVLEWIVSARRVGTRESRVAITAEMAVRNEVANLRRRLD